jgi:hypothetical protein
MNASFMRLERHERGIHVVLAESRTEIAAAKAWRVTEISLRNCPGWRRKPMSKVMTWASVVSVTPDAYHTQHAGIRIGNEELLIPEISTKSSD